MVVRVCHYGPVTAIVLITLITCSATYSAYQLWSLPAHVVYFFRTIHFVTMYTWIILIVKNFLQAIYTMGYVPHGWAPANKSDKQYLQYCHTCQSWKAPRSHHCSQCGRCVLKMDHHCPWVNNCVSHNNQPSFCRFLAYVVCGCSHALIINMNFLYRLFTREYVIHRRHGGLLINTYTIMSVLLGSGLAIGVIIGVGLLLGVQLKGIIQNKTQIEDWIVAKAKRRRKNSADPIEPFVYPYHLGYWQNFKEVINLSGVARGNGITWTIRPGCDQYTLTVEQLEQKKLKKKQSVECIIKESYNGSWCTCRYGIKAWCCRPILEGDYIVVNNNEVFTLTRWQRYWVYGDLVISDEDKQAGLRRRGWFPRRCIKLPDKHD
ncbi:palmitoyltransferase ZDHHC6-like isoform X2 [Dysidea avara]|uniref:palmitoyltransferase ZDHHC6-like isoform X2 n=1 Tax=Dysidea avara TaxID=196820 RepID=UPI003321A585